MFAEELDKLEVEVRSLKAQVLSLKDLVSLLTQDLNEHTFIDYI